MEAAAVAVALLRAARILAYFSKRPPVFGRPTLRLRGGDPRRSIRYRHRSCSCRCYVSTSHRLHDLSSPSSPASATSAAPRGRLLPSVLFAFGLCTGLGLLLNACSASEHDSPITGGGAPTTVTGGAGCGESEGCPCPNVGATAECKAFRKSGSYVACSNGMRTCESGGLWSKCVGDSVYDGGSD
jgi:hypothetical protein